MSETNAQVDRVAVRDVTLDPDEVSHWAAQPYEALFTLSKEQTAQPQLDALIRRFEGLRAQIPALDKLASRQEVDRIECLENAAPLLFDHRVYKSYPMSLIEQRRFDRMTSWLQRLSSHDLSRMSTDDLTSVDGWLDRLDEHGMLMLHSTGTTGKLSFLPRSRTEWPAWEDAFFELWRATSGGVDRRVEVLPNFYPGYRSGHATSAKLPRLFGEVVAGGEPNRHVMYDYRLSADLLSMAARLRTAEERGELDKLELDPRLLDERAKLIAAGRNRGRDFEQWFTKLCDEFRGQRVWIEGPASDLVPLALKGREVGRRCEFAPGSIVFTGGGLKGLKDAPADWEPLVKDFFGVDRLCGLYGMTELIGQAPRCRDGFYHFFPYTIPLLLDPDGNVLPRQGVQTGRFGFFDLLAETYWGGFLSGDQLTMYWDDDCECGWKGPRLDRNIVRFSELEGGDDKISCAGTEQAYSEFMTYVSQI
jgi:hypothetical protein